MINPVPQSRKAREPMVDVATQQVVGTAPVDLEVCGFNAENRKATSRNASTSATIRFFHLIKRGRLLALVLATIGFLGVSVATGPQALALGNELRPGETLFPGDTRWSSNSQYKLIMQHDGNLVAYDPASRPLWSTRTWNNPGSRAVMQLDGNLVLYNPQNIVLWASGTPRNPGAFMAIQDDGNDVIYTPGGAVLYATQRAWGNTRSGNSGAPGNCTWYAYERFRQDSGVYPALSGDAHQWNESARANGWDVWDDATPHSIVVFERGVQGASSSAGHVAWVEEVELRADGRWILIKEMNYTGWNQISSRWVKDVSGMSYILAPS